MRQKALKLTCKKIIRNHTIPLDVVDHVPGTFKAAILHAGTLATALTLLSVLAVTPSHALPQNGSVAGGSATISQPNSTTMKINQTSGNVIINWQGYSIGANESVKYIQPGSSSIALNRVTGVDPSYIYGLLSGNGQVWVINPNGLLVGPGATVQTGSFLASTMNITNENFMSGAYNFTNTRDSQASIVNQGHIQAANGGYVVLAAPSVTNTGSIVANLGSVHLASGDAITLSIDNGSLINVAVSGDVAAAALGVTNTGQITANGGQVLLTARVAGDIMKNIVNNEGIIEAKSIIEKDGIITLDGGDHGITANSGTLDASGKKPGETGGKVTVVGDKVGLFAGSTVDVSGDAGGGTVLIGGNFHGAGPERNASMTYVDRNAAIKADALVNGDGGTVVVWSDDATRFYGNISAKGGVQGGYGGNAEVSGKHSLTYAGLTNLGAAKGKTGTLLLDPDDITIIHAADASADTSDTIPGVAPFIDSNSTAIPSNISDFTINAQLATPANVTVQTSSGSITSLPAVDVMLSGNSLTLQSAAGINLAGTYRGAGALNLNFATTLDLTKGPVFAGSPTVVVTGAGAASTIRAAGETWNLTGSNSGSLTSPGVSFSSVGTLTDTGAGVFDLSAPGASVTGNITTNGGTVTLGTGTNVVGNIAMNNAGTLNMGTAGVVSGTVNSATLDYTNYGSAVTFGLGGTSTGMAGWTGISTVHGSGFSDIVAGSGGTYNTFDPTSKGTFRANGKSLTSFESINDSGAASVNMTGVTMGGVSGNVTTVGGTVTLGTGTNIGGNVNMNSAGTLNMGTTGVVSGTVNTATLNYSSYAADVTVGMTGANTASATSRGVLAVWRDAIRSRTIGRSQKAYLLQAVIACRDSNRPRAYYALGSVHFMLGEFELAIESLEETDRLYPADPGTLTLLAEAYIGNGDIVRGIDTLKQVIELDPQGLRCTLPARNVIPR